jgi:hypothetical protein
MNSTDPHHAHEGEHTLHRAMLDSSQNMQAWLMAVLPGTAWPFIEALLMLIPLWICNLYLSIIPPPPPRHPPPHVLPPPPLEQPHWRNIMDLLDLALLDLVDLLPLMDLLPLLDLKDMLVLDLLDRMTPDSEPRQISPLLMIELPVPIHSLCPYERGSLLQCV